MNLLDPKSLAFDGLSPGDRVVVAMSGGVDSSVCAALCHAAGFDTVGITLQLYDHGQALQRKGACCAGADIHDARQVAAKIGIDHYVLDYESRFRDSVIDDFVETYMSGATPIPCVRCNQTVKFRDLLSTARDLGAKALVTGHYVRRVQGPEGAELHAAADPTRDQSYFLFATTQEQLNFLRFPLGDLRDKDVTRDLASHYGLAVAAKPDSQDICFVPNGRYQDVIRRLRPEGVEDGDIVDLDGKVLGRHNGIVNFTVGQRRGLGIGGAEALYVIKVDAESRQVIVGPRQALQRQRIHAGEVNWLNGQRIPSAGQDVMARIRSTRSGVPARLYPDNDYPDNDNPDSDVDGDNRGIYVDLAEPEEGVSPGQALVLYDGSRVLGGGWIRHGEKNTVMAGVPNSDGLAAANFLP